MKKVFLLLVLAVATFTLFACNSSEYKVDGEFVAFDIHEHSNGTPMVTSVSVTIEKGKIVGYYIDALQSTKSEEGVFTWNAKTKKELGDDYGMVEKGGAVAEWFVQAELIEDYMLENGVDSVQSDNDKYITNITGVTMKDGDYTKLAADALELAKKGEFQAYLPIHHSNGTPNVVYATLTVDAKGNMTDLVLDTLQAKVEEGVFTWNAKSKQELGFDYGMVERGGATLEWFEQAELITDHILENGWTMNGEPSVTGVTITTDSYFETFDLLFGFAGDSVK